jgi:hypothetical protein
MIEIVPEADRRRFPDLEPDFQILDQELMGAFRKQDQQALNLQRQFRRTQLTLIFGGALAAVLGAVQAAYTGVRWPGIAEFILAGLLTAVGWRAAQIKAQEGYLTSRLKAERLRSEYFLFLGRVGPYADEQSRLRQLRSRVAEILTGEEVPAP